MLLILCVVVLTIVSCRTTISPSEKKLCPIDQLLINASDLPGNQWYEVGSRSYRDAPSRVGIERIGTGFSTTFSGSVGENVHRFRNETDTKVGYADLADVWFRLEPEGTTWTPLDIPTDLLIDPLEYRLECSVRPSQTVRSCAYVARYENTVFQLKTDMIIIEDDDLFNIIRLMDQKVKACTSTLK